MIRTDRSTRLVARTLTTLAALGLLAASTLTGCAPSPEDVCEHMMELAKDEGAPVGDEAVKACVEAVEKEKETAGYFDYRTEANCIMDAEKLEDAMKCDKSE